MGFLGDIFNTIFYQPLLRALILLYNYLPWHDLGIAVIVLTVLVKLALYPLGSKGIKSQKALQDLQPKIKEVQERFKEDKTRQAKEVMDIYKKEKINPFSGFLLLLIQLPILFALFRVFGWGIKGIGGLNTSFLGVINITEGSAILAILAGIAQFWQAKSLAPRSGSRHALQNHSKQTPDFSSIMQKQMLYFFPFFSIFILWHFPSAVTLYWLTTTLFTIFQQHITLKKNKNDPNK